MIITIICFAVLIWWLNQQTGPQSQAEREFGKKRASEMKRIYELEEEIRVLKGDNK